MHSLDLNSQHFKGLITILLQLRFIHVFLSQIKANVILTHVKTMENVHSLTKGLSAHVRRHSKGKNVNVSNIR